MNAAVDGVAPLVSNLSVLRMPRVNPTNAQLHEVGDIYKKKSGRVPTCLSCRIEQLIKKIKKRPVSGKISASKLPPILVFFSRCDRQF